ncbi:MAG: hypothetical protein KDA52_01080 [Planctomycetaceae bacterium]|nr:hypothetical protein [Planctomycetaceae bacterium]
MKPSTLTEHVSDWHSQLQVDRENRVVRNVALTGSTSKNGYRYQEQALRDAVALYEQRPVFLDHAADKSRPQERSTRDLVGSIINARYEAGRIRGDIRVLDTDSGRTFLALSESNAPGVGMSHVVLAERDGDDGAVSRIHDVVSVDAVAFPATTTTFRESQDQTSDDEPLREEQVTTRDTEVRPVENGTLDIHEQLKHLTAERDELLTRLRESQNLQRASQERQSIIELATRSGLPEYALTDAFFQQLMISDEKQRSELIRDRVMLIEASRSQLPLSHERMSTSRTSPSDVAFIATIKRQAS